MSYKEIAKTYLQENNPQELERLKAEGKDALFLREVEKAYDEQEQFLIQQMTEDLPDDPIERARALNMARMIAREVGASDLGEFLAKS